MSCPRPGCPANPHDHEGLFKHLLTHERPWRCTSCNIDRVRRISLKDHVLKVYGRDLSDAEIATAGAYHVAIRVWADGGAFVAPGTGPVASPITSAVKPLAAPPMAPDCDIAPGCGLITVAIRIPDGNEDDDDDDDDDSVASTTDESPLDPKLADLSAQEIAGDRHPATYKYPYC